MHACVHVFTYYKHNISRIHAISIYNHIKMVQGCRIDTGSCKKPLSKKDSPKALGTRLSCKTGTGLGGQRARQA